MRFKIFFLIILFGMNILVVRAESDWQTEKIEGDDVEVEYRYRWYIEEKKGDYFNYKQQISSLPYVDKENYKWGEFGSWKDTCSEESEGIDVEEADVYPYKRLIPVNKIIFTNIASSPIEINKLELYKNAESLEYRFSDYSFKDERELTEEEKSNINFTLEQNQSFSIFVPSGFRISEFSLIINTTSGNLKLEITRSGTSYPIILESNLTLENGSNEILMNSAWVKNKVYGSFEYSKDKPNADFYTTIYPIEHKCRERTLSYYFYNIERKYYDDNYYKYIEGYIKDEDDYIILYRKIDIEEDIKSEIVEDTIGSNISNNEMPAKVDNPQTGDNIIYYFLIAVTMIFLLSLFIYFTSKKRMSNEYYS